MKYDSITRSYNYGMKMNYLRKKFAKNLKAIRETRGLTQEGLAEKLKISARYIQQLEGKSVPNVKIDTIAALAKALHVDAQEFLE